MYSVDYNDKKISAVSRQRITNSGVIKAPNQPVSIAV